MATWGQIVSSIQAFPAQQLSDTMWSLEHFIDDTDRTQRVYLMHEVLKPDMEFVKIVSPLDSVPVPDIEATVRKPGSLTIGAFSYMQFPGGGGMLFIGNSIPLQILDLSDQQTFLLYLQLLAQAADWIKTRA
jgi:hypothetical protein